MMRAVGHIASGRLVGLSVLVAAGVLALPILLRADPAATPAPGAAQPPPLTVPRPGMPEAGSARREANRERIQDARIERMHAGLQLSPDQERLWPPVADALHGLVGAQGVGFRQRLATVASSNDALKMQGDHMAKVGAAMGALAEATKPLVAGLTPDQKAKLPTLLERAPLRKIVARAFGAPLDAASGQGTQGAQGAATSAGAPAKPAGEPASEPTKTAPPKEPDDDD